MSTHENWVLKNFPPFFVRLGIDTAVNALAELFLWPPYVIGGGHYIFAL